MGTYYTTPSGKALFLRSKIFRNVCDKSGVSVTEYIYLDKPEND